MKKKISEPIERITIKLPKSIATYFRTVFPHGRRSEFVAKCIIAYKQDDAVKAMEAVLRKATKSRQ